ncbi:type II toxin-antitoxin system HicA family toxin [Loigolactobacillus coryniformis]|uniref:type II toxin-antitoxin system HicA family toxin n=1 Tax=Loigolactobacillus coryniformis TaxID=1610 RepID=UPI001F026353|nr:type II toxin-antitoxin system HicA family toxin [Loigolactobacillus coryniformis]
MPIKTFELIRLLEQNGFEEIRAAGSHHFYKNKRTGATTYRHTAGKYQREY